VKYNAILSTDAPRFLSRLSPQFKAGVTAVTPALWSQRRCELGGALNAGSASARGYVGSRHRSQSGALQAHGATVPSARTTAGRTKLAPHTMKDLLRFGSFSFGSIQIDGVTYEHDVVIDGSIRKRRRKPSKPFRGSYGHTPLSAAEDIPWNCSRLVVGTGAHGALPIMEDVGRAARARQVELVTVPTAQAIEELAKGAEHTHAILHITC
jgi:hypothetical protein